MVIKHSDMPADEEKSKEKLVAELTALRATLAATEERLAYTRRFVEDSPISLILIKDGKCFDCNQAALSLFGLDSKEEIIGKTPIDFAPEFQPDGRLSTEAAAYYIQKALDEGRVSFEWQSVRRDGRHIMTDVRLVALVFGSERFIECVSIDITERNNAEIVLEQSRNHMEALARIGTLATSSLDLKEVLNRILAGTLEATGAGVGMIFLRDLETGNLEWGASIGLSDAFVAEFETRLVKPGEGLTGRIAMTGEPIYIAEDSSHDPRIARAVIEREGLNTFVGVPVRAGDDIVGVMNILTRPPAVLSEYSMSLISAIGTHVGFAIRNARLFSERKQAEEDLLKSELKSRALLEAMPDMMFRLSREGVHLDYHAPNRDALFIDPSKFINRGVQDVLPPEISSSYLHNIHETLASRAMQVFEYALSFSPNEKRLYEARMVPSGTDDVLVIVREITERKRAETEKKKLEAQLRQSQKLETIGTMVGGIAHDFNNMMQPIKSCVEMMSLQLPADSPLSEYVNLISRSVDRGRDLVRQLLNFSRKRDHEMVSLHVQQVVDETLHLLRAAVPSSVEILKDIDTECGPVMADPINIQQIVMNLCANACDAMAGQGKLSVSLAETDIDVATARRLVLPKPGKYLKLVVGDTGHGMDEETRKKIFDPFFTTKEVGKGTGLGLSVVHSIVANHGGAIAVTSEPGHGTEFHVYLPCCDKMPEIVVERDEEFTQGGQGRILFVDDENDIVFIGGEMLQSLGYEAVACSSQVEALKKLELEPQRYALVISDYSMPGMNGIRFAEKIREVRSDIPILFITGNEQVIPPDKLSEMRVQGVVLKPFDMKTLGALIRKVLDRG